MYNVDMRHGSYILIHIALSLFYICNPFQSARRLQASNWFRSSTIGQGIIMLSCRFIVSATEAHWYSTLTIRNNCRQQERGQASFIATALVHTRNRVLTNLLTRHRITMTRLPLPILLLLLLSPITTIAITTSPSLAHTPLDPAFRNNLCVQARWWLSLWVTQPLRWAWCENAFQRHAH